MYVSRFRITSNVLDMNLMKAIQCKIMDVECEVD